MTLMDVLTHPSILSHSKSRSKLRGITPEKEINKDEFLDFDLLYLDGTTFSVRHIIKFCANQLGGIHFERSS